ncbi:phosphatase [Aureococcus anophagefferens]|nr:phosphatase [Aureococcus anophagefferens]
MVVASQAFSDAGRQRRERREGSRDITAPPVVDDDLELRVVEAARRKAHATRGPRVANGGFVTSGLGAPRMFAAPDDIRKRTIVSQHIVLGCREDAMDLKGLQELGVTHVLNACSQLPNYHPDHFVYHKIAILDAPKAPIVTCAEVAAQFLQRVERVGGRCLVHCIAGSSRSVTLTLMHLMISHRVPLHVGFHHVNRMRPQANPNEGFKLQLALLEVKVLGGSSVAAKDAGTQWALRDELRQGDRGPRARGAGDDDELRGVDRGAARGAAQRDEARGPLHGREDRVEPEAAREVLRRAP